MVRVNKLRGKMVEMEHSVASLADAVGVDRATLYRRFSNPEEFTVGEVTSIKEQLGLTNEEATDIFFAN